MLAEGFFKDEDSSRQLLQTSFKADVSNEEWLLIRALKLASGLLFDLSSGSYHFFNSGLEFHEDTRRHFVRATASDMAG